MAQRLWDPALEESDQLGQGKTLAAALEKLDVNLVLCGDSCLDQLNSLVPGIAANTAGLTYLTETEKIESIDQDQVTVIRRREKGKREKIAVRLPALLAVTEKSSEAKERAGLEETLDAFTQEIPCWDLGDLGLAAEVVGVRGAKTVNIQTRSFQPPLTRPKTPDFRLPAEKRLRAIISGDAPRKQGEVVTGETEKLVEKIIGYLSRETEVKKK
jgi:electron transfer flavoprotein beta subunit